MIILRNDFDAKLSAKYNIKNFLTIKYTGVVIAWVFGNGYFDNTIIPNTLYNCPIMIEFCQHADKYESGLMQCDVLHFSQSHECFMALRINYKLQLVCSFDENQFREEKITYILALPLIDASTELFPIQFEHS